MKRAAWCPKAETAGCVSTISFNRCENSYVVVAQSISASWHTYVSLSLSTRTGYLHAGIFWRVLIKVKWRDVANHHPVIPLPA
jgi:hypothetical protein